MLEISKITFFAGFRVWHKRQTLQNKFWREIAPQNRKPLTKGRKKKAELKVAESKCKNMFHFIPRHSNLSNQRPTKCPCSLINHNFSAPRSEKDIRSYLFKYPSTRPLISADVDNRTTRCNAIRRAHDRGKKRKL